MTLILGTSSLEFKDLFLDGTAHIDTLDVDVNATVAGTLGVTGATTLSSTLGVTGATTLSSTLGVTGATTLSSTLGVTGAITGSSTLQATTITATTAFVPDACDGASLGTVSLEFSDLFLADGALIAFGNDQDVTITHLADAGLLLNGARGLFFNDTTQYINAPNGTTLDIAATDEIELNATLIDINGAVDISGNLDVGGNLVVTGTTTFNGGTLTMGDAATDNVVFGADINSNIIPNTDDTYDLGSSSQEWRNLYIDGTANIDSLVADTADINGGTIDGATIATSDITVGSGKTLNVSAGTLTLADNQISGDKVEGGTIAATTITTLTSTTGNITSVNATTVDTTNLEVTTLKAKDGTAAGSIADSTGVVTLASSVLTTTDINGGTVDGVTIGGSSAGDITYANLSDGTITITAFADEDDMSSDSATLVPTQQSVKAYVDSQVGTVDTLSEILANGNTTGSTDIAVDSAQKVQFRDAAIYLNSSVDGQLDIVADTEIQIAATTVDLNGNLDVSGTALVAGVLTTTAATVFNGGFASNADSTLGTDKKVQFRDCGYLHQLQRRRPVRYSRGH
jgi:fibronectin-binding autotransporter adhesin